MDEQERLLDVANIAGTDVTASRPYAETKRKELVEMENDVFRTYK